MFKKKRYFGVLAFVLLAAACSTFNSEEKRKIAAVQAWQNRSAAVLPSSALNSLSSGGKLNLSHAELIIDNDRSFQRKIDMIKGAQKSIRMVYYIYSDDFSSSLFTQSVIEAAERGVKVSLLVDFITNYERLDLFDYMQTAGRGNIAVRFYGLPTTAILKGAVYQTLPCSKRAVESPTQCQTEKQQLISQIGDPESTWFSKIYLSGLYGKNLGLLQTAIGLGGQFDPKSFKGAPASPEEKAQLKEFAKLVYKAKIKGDLISKMKVGIALQTYGTTLNPIMNEITGRLPLHTGGGPDWDHITDYVHHKLLVVDGSKFQLGGRNIEDSYHTDQVKKAIPEATGKYTFMDTDFYAETREGKEIESAFDRLFAFSAMTGDLKRVQQIVPNEYDVNAEAFQKSLGACLSEGKATPKDLESCVSSKIVSMPGYVRRELRVAKIQTDIAKKIKIFQDKYKVTTESSWKAGGDRLEPADLKLSETFYIENLSFTKNNPSKRLFKSDIGAEASSGKYIHAAWVKGLESTCAVSAKDKRRRRVILHSAYLFMPSNLTNALGNMINGKWDCRYVDVALITNSFKTTDLNIINIFARYQLQSLLAFNQNNNNEYKAKFKYYEYLPQADGAGLSLHSKVSILGDDVIVGSANADVRSYYMDTNNGVYIRNALNLVRDYSSYIDQLISQKRVIELTAYYANVSDQELKKQNIEILQEMKQKWDKDGKHLTQQRLQTALNYLDERGQHIRKVTQAILSAPTLLGGSLPGSPDGGGTDYQQIKELDEMANGFDAIWKIL